MENIFEFIKNLSSNLDSILLSLGIFGPILSCFIIALESILPILPLCVFITLEFYYFGNIIGFIISWIFTCIGCALSFSLFRYLFRDKFNKLLRKLKNKEFADKLMGKINDIKLSSLAVLVSIPFTPAFLVNIIASQSKISFKKYMTAMFIGKIFMVYFWGYIGTTLIECLTHPIYLIKVVLMLLLSFVLSKIITKIFNIE